MTEQQAPTSFAFTTGLGTCTFRPTRIKNLHITEWCLFCKKAKGYTGIILIGMDDPEAVDAPEFCMCWLFAPVPLSQPVLTLHPYASISISEYNALLKLHNGLMSEYMKRGDVLMDVLHFLNAMSDVAALTPAGMALLDEVRAVVEVAA